MKDDLQRVRYWVDLAGYVLPAREVSGEERLGRLFRFEVRLRTDLAADLDPERFVKARAAVLLGETPAEARRVQGVVTDMCVGASRRDAPELRIVIEPRIALARHRVDMRIFRDRTVPEIVSEIFTEMGADVELRLREPYVRRAYTVQFGESDLDFAQRLLEGEGIFHAFGSGDVVVLGDSAAAYEPLEEPRTLSFRAAASLEAAGEAIRAIRERVRLGAAKVTLRDFSPERPRVAMEASFAGPWPSGPELYDYPGDFDVPSEGARRARLVAESLAPEARSVSGDSTCHRLRPGCSFVLEGAPDGLRDGELVVTGVRHAWRADGGAFGCAFDALDARDSFRPARLTPAPRLAYPMSALVTGPPGADVHTDALGRVKLHFPWDRVWPLDDSCSDWVPVAQDNTGHSAAIPRIGWEVLVHFIDGDPDRPVVLGRLYNGKDVPPESLPDGKTVSSLQSLSSPTRDGGNLLRMDDAAGREHMLLEAERDQTIEVANDERQDVGKDERRTVGGNEVVAIGASDTLLVGGAADAGVQGNQTWTTAGDRRVAVGGSDTVVVAKDHELSIGGAHMRKVATEDSVSSQDLKEKIGAVLLETSVGDNSTSARRTLKLTVGGAHVEVARKNKIQTTGLGRAETVGGVLCSKSVASTSLSAGKGRTTTVGGALSVSAALGVEIAGPTVEMSVGGEGTFVGVKSLTLKVGGSQVVLAAGVIHIKAASVLVHAEGTSEVAVGEAAVC